MDVKAAQDVGEVVVFSGLHGVGGFLIQAKLLEAGEEIVELVTSQHLKLQGCDGVLAMSAECGQLQGGAYGHVYIVGELALAHEGLVPIGDVHS